MIKAASSRLRENLRCNEAPFPQEYFVYFKEKQQSYSVNYPQDAGGDLIIVYLK